MISMNLPTNRLSFQKLVINQDSFSNRQIAEDLYNEAKQGHIPQTVEYLDKLGINIDISQSQHQVIDGAVSDNELNKSKQYSAGNNVSPRKIITDLIKLALDLAKSKFPE